MIKINKCEYQKYRKKNEKEKEKYIQGNSDRHINNFKFLISNKILIYELSYNSAVCVVTMALKWSCARGVVFLPRGVRSSMPIWMRYGS